MPCKITLNMVRTDPESKVEGAWARLIMQRKPYLSVVIHEGGGAKSIRYVVCRSRGGASVGEGPWDIDPAERGWRTV